MTRLGGGNFRQTYEGATVSNCPYEQYHQTYNSVVCVVHTYKMSKQANTTVVTSIHAIQEWYVKVLSLALRLTLAWGPKTCVRRTHCSNALQCVSLTL